MNSAVIPVLLVGFMSTGCVLSSTFDQVQSERDALMVRKRSLEEQIRLLEIANKSLDDQVVALVGEREDLLDVRENLAKDLASTRSQEAELASTLRSREEELALTAAALVAQSAKVDELQSTYEGLVDDLQEEVAKGQIHISQLREGLQVGVSQEILFPSGSARLSRDGTAVLKTVASRFSDSTYTISVEGHTDAVPISGSLTKQYPTNWELAGARASSVVRLFAKSGVAPGRLQAVSRGDTDPVGDNKTAEGRARNRRIEILLRPLADAAADSGSSKSAGSGS